MRNPYEMVAWAYSVEQDVYLMLLRHGFVLVTTNAMIAALEHGFTGPQIAERVVDKLATMGMPLQSLKNMPEDAIPVLVGGLAA
jgi:hypothetical protein